MYSISPVHVGQSRRCLIARLSDDSEWPGGRYVISRGLSGKDQRDELKAIDSIYAFSYRHLRGDFLRGSQVQFTLTDDRVVRIELGRVAPNEIPVD